MPTCSTRMAPIGAQLLTMARPGLTGMVASSAVVGYLAHAASPHWPVVPALWAGIALLSAAAAIFNQVQERSSDAQMARTRLRPVASGAMCPEHALLLAGGAMLGGFGLLLAVSLPAALVGLLALLLYNLAYTPLKRYTSLALLPGAVSGALPVAAGWLAAHGSLNDPRLVSWLLFMVLWQVPHFIALAISERDDYERAGFRLVPAAVDDRQLLQLARFWTLALAVGGLQLAAVGLLRHPLGMAGLVGLMAWLGVRALTAQRRSAEVMGRDLKLLQMLFLLTVVIDAVLL